MNDIFCLYCNFCLKDLMNNQNHELQQQRSRGFNDNLWILEHVKQLNVYKENMNWYRYYWMCLQCLALLLTLNLQKKECSPSLSHFLKRDENVSSENMKTYKRRCDFFSNELCSSFLKFYLYLISFFQLWNNQRSEDWWFFMLWFCWI